MESPTDSIRYIGRRMRAIQAICLSKSEVDESWVWPNARGGVVTPRLVYRRLREEAREGTDLTS